jgi:protein-disulfide isomerase
MREIWFAVIALLTLAGPLPALAQNAPAPSTPPSAAAMAEPLALTPDDRILGKSDAPITIIEYASMTCPHCAHFATDVLPQLQQKWIDTGKAKLIMRDYPLDEPALRAAMVARCQPADKFYPFVETLFAQQRQWVLAKDYQSELAKLALLAGMNKTKFEACLADKSGEDKVLQSRLVATEKLGVNSTPTFFINGTKFDGAPEMDALDAALSKAAGS